MKPSSILIMGVILSAVLFAAHPVYGETSSGIMGQTIGNNKLSLQVSGMQIVDNSGQKEVTLTIIFKNLDFKPQLFNIFYMKMKDSDGREYSPEIFKSNSISAAIPIRDAAQASVVFVIPSSVSPKNFYYAEWFQSPLLVDLSRTKTPGDPIPLSDWVLSGNKGFKANDNNMELAINDERYSGQYYVVDITIKNIGKDKVNYNPFYAYAKDQSGVIHSYAIFSDEANTLSSGELAPNDFVRGDIAFEIESSKPVMFIWFGDSGFGSYFNTGTISRSSPPPATSQNSQINDSQSQKEYSAKLTLTSSLTEKTKNLTISLKNPKSSDAKIYEAHFSFPDDALVKSASGPSGWTKEINGDSVTFSTDSKPLLANKSGKFTLKLDRVVKSLDWDAYDEDGNIINSKTAKVMVRS